MGTRRYNVTNNSGEKDSIQMLYITSSICENDWISSFHSHDFTEIFYVKSGQGTFVVEGTEYKVKKNDLVVVNPYIEHTEFSEKEDPLDYFVLGIENLKLQKKENYSVLSLGNDAIRDCFYKIHSEMIKKDSDFDIICQHYFQIILLNIMRKTSINFSIDEPVKGSRECQLIKDYIDTNYSDPITLDMLSAKYNLNKYHLCHRFNQIYGTSPISYLSLVRIETTKDLLKSTNHSMQEISEMVGFSSQSYLSQAFKKNVGETPQMYRKKYLVNEAK